VFLHVVSRTYPGRYRHLLPDVYLEAPRRVKLTAVIALVWTFEIRPGTSEQFERFYGADGEWTALSRRSRSFLGSSFLKDIASETRYILVEYWGEMVVYEKHVADFERPIEVLQRERDRFVERVDALGVFNTLDTPDRVGPTWSRRGG
jgi:hypothetical protein